MRQPHLTFGEALAVVALAAWLALLVVCEIAYRIGRWIMRGRRPPLPPPRSRRPG